MGSERLGHIPRPCHWSLCISCLFPYFLLFLIVQSLFPKFRHAKFVCKLVFLILIIEIIRIPVLKILTWQEKSEIIATTDIKQKIVIIQLVVLQRFSYSRQIGITPTLSLQVVLM